ncbi:quorum sensing histidine kinase QseC [Spirabiliibacterium falconis]|uniref:quorum sensing histidine kinase QseC n=1 Tax=Spirabiliibacterium falconis TaxID=572023 RepID=UPI001AAC522D|nr:quorum sensing histidine kinase QseC [Spirabiliibacterium falconis]MBE2894967.1 two-component system sensor histidine kinase QseC [Spirabiliibacterium falconis]
MKTSLRLRLILILSLATLLLWIVASAVAWFTAKEEADKVFDRQQILFAQRLASSNLHDRFSRPLPPPGRFLHKKYHGDDDAISFALFNAQGDRLFSDGDQGNFLQFKPKKGFGVQQINGESWRVFWLPTQRGRLFIAVGQAQDYRDDLVEKLVLGQLWIWLAGLPILLLLIFFVVNAELKSLKRLQQQLHQRSPLDNSPLDNAHLPSEITPLVASLNHFIIRTAHLFERERRFTSDAAHELRSPLTALRVQTEIAQLPNCPDRVRQQALHQLTYGVERASQLIEQLLMLSRLDHVNELVDTVTINWGELIHDVIVHEMPFAEQKQITIDFIEHDAPSVQGQPVLLTVLIRNLINNAINYCPNYSHIDLILDERQFIVQDNGDGVADEHIEKLGHRFYRPAGQNEKGAGLGLSIVERIAQLHRFTIHYTNREPSGFKVLVTFSEIS